MLALAKPVDPAKVSGPEAVVFFKKSGLPIEKLKDIWKVAARTSNEYLTKDEFYIALRLIAYAQNNMKSDEDSIMFDLKVGLPNFDDGPSILSKSSSSTTQQSSNPAMFSSLPSLDELDFKNPNV